MADIIQFPTTVEIDDEKIRIWLDLSFLTFYDALLLGSPQMDCLLRKFKRVHRNKTLQVNMRYIDEPFRRMMCQSYRARRALPQVACPDDKERMEDFCDSQMRLLPGMLQGTLDSISCGPLKGKTPEELLEEKRERYYTAVYDLLQSQCKKAYYAGYRQVHEAITA